MKTLVEELQHNHDEIVEELKERAKSELQGTLYDVLEQQKVISARYDNVVEVIIDYLEDNDRAMLVQHHIIMFMQRYYVSVDAEQPLTDEMINRRDGEINKAVEIYFQIWEKYTNPAYASQLTSTLNIIREIIGQMNTFLKKRLPELSTRLPLLKMRGIEYDPDSHFDIDPDHWPYS